MLFYGNFVYRLFLLLIVYGSFTLLSAFLLPQQPIYIQYWRHNFGLLIKFFFYLVIIIKYFIFF